jgi:hypothetical protein
LQFQDASQSLIEASFYQQQGAFLEEFIFNSDTAELSSQGLTDCASFSIEVP